jgi:hypothetical protein
MYPFKSQRLVCIAFVYCLATLTIQDCGTKTQSPGNNQITNNSTRPAPPPEPTKPHSTTEAETIYGITIDDANEHENIVPSIERIERETGRKITTRIVIDPQQKLSKDYVESVKEIKKVSDVMALVGDSHDMHRFGSGINDRAYQKRINECYKKLGAYVDIWEIGNEVNGIWAGWKEDEKKEDKDQPWNKASDDSLEAKRQLIVARTKAAYKEILDLNPDAKIALTLYYNGERAGDECWDRPEYGMYAWVDTYLKDAALRGRLNYVFISFYSDDCPILNEDSTEENIKRWVEVFNTLTKTFGIAEVGFGEFAPQCKLDKCYDKDKKEYHRLCDDCTSAQKKFIAQYYNVYHASLKKVPKYVGGYFYWYFPQDMIPSDRPAVVYLIDAIKPS